MRRFCEVNGITGTSTTVDDNLTDKEGMKYCKVNMDGADFIIHYSGEPNHMELKPLEEYPEQWRPYEGYYRDHASEIHYHSTLCITYNRARVNSRENFWYDELTAYFADLNKRRVGGE